MGWGSEFSFSSSPSEALKRQLQIWRPSKSGLLFPVANLLLPIGREKAKGVGVRFREEGKYRGRGGLAPAGRWRDGLYAKVHQNSKDRGLLEEASSQAFLIATAAQRHRAE